ncbi:MAG: ATP-binding protein [Granulosicoccus sp.]
MAPYLTYGSQTGVADVSGNSFTLGVIEMKIVTQLRITLVMVLVLGLVGAGLALWNLERSRTHLIQINLSHLIYESYLTLESHTYQLFKQYGDAIIIGDRNQRKGKQRLIALIEDDIGEIRNLVATKISLAGTQATVKLESLAEIESSVKRLITRLDRFSPTGTGELDSDWERLSLVLNDEIDNKFHVLINDALQQEKADVQAISDAVDAAMVQQRSIVLLFSLAAILGVVGVVLMLNSRVTQPIKALMTGVEKFGEGQMDYRIHMTGRDELSEIGQTFDVMAGRVAEKNMTLSTEKETLTRAVEDRTQRLSQMLEELKRSDESRTRMIADVSHELRTPMTIIKGEADIALRGIEKPVEVYQDALRRVREAVNHTTRLVDDLLFVARNEAGEVKLKLSEVDLRQVVSDVMLIFGHDVPVKSKPIEAWIRGDADRICQALLVLLENARHHGGDEILIEIVCTTDDALICVEDSGPGMSDYEKGQAFERFFRGSNAAERYSSGAGLGLPVALAIAQAHGGTISLHDRPGGGLIAQLQLPILKNKTVNDSPVEAAA